MSMLTDSVEEFTAAFFSYKRCKAFSELIDKNIDGISEQILGKELVKIVKSKAFYASISSLIFSWIPFLGGAIVSFLSIFFVWTMYLAVNKKIGLKFFDNIGKTIISGVITNLIICYIAIAILDTVSSLLVGGLGIIIIFCICYIAMIASAIVYMKILTNFFANKGDK